MTLKELSQRFSELSDKAFKRAPQQDGKQLRA
jgi:hypothetical protein